jgi:CRP-like cAMP-binding protein
LLAHFTPRHYPAGAIIFREGQVVHQVFVVAAGNVALEMEVPARGRQRLLSLGPGDLLGWSPLVAKGGMTATATALADTELWVANVDSIEQLCASDPAIGYAWMQSVAAALAQRLLATRLQLLDLFQQDATMSDRLMAAP